MDRQMERFVLAESLSVDQPYPGGQKVHFAKGQPVAVNTEGALYELIRDRLRAEDGRDQAGQAAVMPREWADVPSRLSARERGLSG